MARVIDWSLQMDAPPPQEYGKLSYAGAGVASTVYDPGKRRQAQNPRSDK